MRKIGVAESKTEASAYGIRITAIQAAGSEKRRVRVLVSNPSGREESEFLVMNIHAEELSLAVGEIDESTITELEYYAEVAKAYSSACSSFAFVGGSYSALYKKLLISCHTDTDTGGSVDKKLGEFGRKHRGFHIGFVKGRNHIHSIFLDILQHLFGDTLQTALGVTARSRRVAVSSTEVTLRFDQPLTQTEILPQTHQCIVDRRIAVRVVITHNFTDHFCTLHGLVTFGDAHAVHGIQNTPVHRFQAVTHIGNGPADIHTE